MKKIIKETITFPFKLTFLLVTIIPFTIMAIVMYVTKDKNTIEIDEFISFVNKFVNTYDNKIKKFLGLDDLEHITVANCSDENKQGMFKIFNETDNSYRIYIFFNSIRHHSIYGNKFIIKYKAIKTLIHELTHLKQYKDGHWNEMKNAPSPSTSLYEYENNKFEKEARYNANKFIIMNLLSIIKFIKIN